MASPERTLVIATRGSALALAQAHATRDRCRQLFPGLAVELKIIKTTGDKRQRASMAKPDASLPKGLFTKELEVALLRGQADLAVHSLKDLPTELPAGLTLGAVSPREDVRDVLIYRDAACGRVAGPRQGFGPGLRIQDLPPDAVVATSSTRRRAQLLAVQPRLRVVEIRGNVATRLRKLWEQPELDGTLLALAGLKRLSFELDESGWLRGDAVPEGTRAAVLPVEVMLPCVGQAALGFEIREGDERMAEICRRLNHHDTLVCVTAERAFLRAMGGGCQSPVAAYAEVVNDTLRFRAVSFRDELARRGELTGKLSEAAVLGERLAETLK